MVEGARLESVYRSKAYRGFESLSLRKNCSISKYLRDENTRVRAEAKRRPAKLIPLSPQKQSKASPKAGFFYLNFK